MPRSLSIPAGTYPAGTYGPFSVDAFTRNDAEELMLTLPTSGWPTNTNTSLLRITLTWDLGGGAVIVFKGGARGRTGELLTEVRAGVSIPRLGNEKRAVTRGDVLVEVLTSITLASPGTLTAV